MKKEASFWDKKKENKVQCKLCSHNCIISDGKLGICGVRKNENGNLYSMIYGSASSLAADPIEKKPLYHFYPGTKAFSMGTVGCNFRCLHCQNYSISTANASITYLRDITPEQVIKSAKEYSCQGVSYTYNEPTIWHEFTFDSAKLVKKEGMYTCYVTNGYINEEPLKEISKYLDAMNIDVKSFSDDFYKKICKAKLQPVLSTCELAKELGIHIELTYLVIPTYNDSIGEVEKFCKWVVEEIGDSTPVHFSRFHPDFNLQNIPKTPMQTLLNIFETAKKSGILYPYLGNVLHGEYENTYCPKCGNLMIERNGYFININGLDKNKCNSCGQLIDIVYDKYKKQKI
jgi:pyruvate formate lyase activating enzyme